MKKVQQQPRRRARGGRRRAQAVAAAAASGGGGAGGGGSGSRGGGVSSSSGGVHPNLVNLETRLLAEVKRRDGKITMSDAGVFLQWNKKRDGDFRKRLAQISSVKIRMNAGKMNRHVIFLPGADVLPAASDDGKSGGSNTVSRKAGGSAAKGGGAAGKGVKSKISARAAAKAASSVAKAGGAQAAAKGGKAAAKQKLSMKSKGGGKQQQQQKSAGGPAGNVGHKMGGGYDYDAPVRFIADQLKKRQLSHGAATLSMEMLGNTLNDTTPAIRATIKACGGLRKFVVAHGSGRLQHRAGSGALGGVSLVGNGSGSNASAGSNAVAGGGKSVKGGKVLVGGKPSMQQQQQQASPPRPTAAAKRAARKLELQQRKQEHAARQQQQRLAQRQQQQAQQQHPQHRASSNDAAWAALGTAYSPPPPPEEVQWLRVRMRGAGAGKIPDKIVTFDGESVVQELKQALLHWDVVRARLVSGEQRARPLEFMRLCVASTGRGANNADRPLRDGDTVAQSNVRSESMVFLRVIAKQTSSSAAAAGGGGPGRARHGGGARGGSTRARGGR